MIKNYLIIAWRNLKKNKLTSFINVFGLTVSISICLLIAVFVYDEINYDKFEKDYTEIYRLEQHAMSNGVVKHWAASPAPLKEMLQTKFPEAEFSTRLMTAPFGFIKIGENKFKEDNCFFVDPAFFDVMGLPLVHGNAKVALLEPYSVVITEKLALKFFGQTNVLGQNIDINSHEFKVTGILKDLPENSHLQIGCLRPIEIMRQSNPAIMQNWAANSLYTYVRLKKGVNPQLLTDKIRTAMIEVGLMRKEDDLFFQLHKISEIHLGGNREKELFPNSSWTYIYIFISVGFLILLLASINYINLTTSRSLERSKEIGVRKTLGAFKKNLVAQFLTESVLITLISYLTAMVLVFISLPTFNTITAKHLSIVSILNPFFILVSVSIVIFIGILAGIYPALVISSFEPVNTLKGINTSTIQSGFSFGLRKGLVVFQFVISAFLVISSLVVIRQISYMFNKPMGYEKENVMVLPSFRLTDQLLDNIRDELKTAPSILGVSATSAVPGKRVILEGISFPGQETMGSIRTMFVDQDYLKTMGVEISRGRHFKRGIITDTTENIILNEAAVKSYDLKNPIGTIAQLDFFGGGHSSKVVGVVKDFHQGSLHNAIEPAVFIVKPFYNSIVIKFTGDAETAKSTVNAAWNKIFPDQLFTYTMLKDDLGTLYKTESTLKKVLILFTSIAILIATLGLFGLIFFSNTLRKKEIGIRKVLGADNSSIVYLLSKEYVVLIVASLLISVPVSNYALHQWLNNFAYRIDVPVSTFVSGVSITLFVAFTTVLVQGLKSALANPVKNLRTE